MRRSFVIPICLCSCLAQSRLNLTGSVSGTLAGEDGTHIAGARVTLALAQQNVQGRPRPTVWTAASAVDGAFRFGGLSEGRYQLCAQATGTTWLNPCEWGLQPPTVTLSTSQANANVDFVLKKGVTLPIRIDDPGHFLPQNEGKSPGAYVLLAVRNDAAAVCLAPLLSRDADGRTHQVIVPFGATVKLVVQSAFFHISDASGTPVGLTGSFVSVAVPSAQQPSPITFVVTGGGR